MYSKLLLEARKAHNTRTGHKHIFIGLNFIDCLECRKHAHLTSDCQRLIAHAAHHKHVETIDAKDF